MDTSRGLVQEKAAPSPILFGMESAGVKVSRPYFVPASADFRPASIL